MMVCLERIRLSIKKNVCESGEDVKSSEVVLSCVVGNSPRDGRYMFKVVFGDVLELRLIRSDLEQRLREDGFSVVVR